MSSSTGTPPTYNLKALRQTTASSRTRAGAEHAERVAASIARISKLREELAMRIMSNLPSVSEVERMARDCRSSTCIAVARPPLKKDTVLPNGDTVREFVLPAAETHFAGFTGADDETDHTKDAIPLISLFQGFRARSGEADPSTLPGGKTVVDIVQEKLTAMFENPEDSFVVRSVWNGKQRRCELHLVWDLEGWDAQQAKIAARVAKHRAERASALESSKPQMTLEEYEARRQARRAKADSDGFTPVQSRRRGK